jgi:hypothetical protein
MPKKELHISISDSADLLRFKCRLWTYATILIIILLLAACGNTSSTQDEFGERGHPSPGAFPPVHMRRSQPLVPSNAVPCWIFDSSDQSCLDF